jgi:glycosyltransferase involved in cell wall biosynthesis
MQPKISVIIPVYNTAPYLRRCLDSIINQTLREIEIICVNDASTDSSLDILNEYATYDSRIRIVSLKKNSGECAARNTALALAQGEYLGFVDSDDSVDKNFYNLLYNQAKFLNAEIARCETLIINSEKKQYTRLNNLILENKMNFWTFFWSAIYKKVMIINNSICFPEGITNCGDTVFLTKAILHANIIQTVDDIMYNWHRRNDSMSGSYTERKILSAISAIAMNIEALNSATDNMLDKKGYIISSMHNFMRLYYHINYVTDKKSKKFCAEAIQIFYKKCKYIDLFNHTLCERYPALYPCLREEGSDGLVNFLIRHNTFEKLSAANLRARLRAGRSHAVPPLPVPPDPGL